MSSIVPFETRMSASFDWRLTQGSLFFDGAGFVQETLRRIAQRLEDGQAEYAIAGDMAFFAHGFRQHTDHIEIVVESPAMIREIMSIGYVPDEPNGAYRDQESGVRIAFKFAGERIGHNPALTIPSPKLVAVELQNRRYLPIESLIEIALVQIGSRMVHHAESNVLSLIRIRRLERNLGASFHPSIRAEHERIWGIARMACPRMVLLWTDQQLPADVSNMTELAEAFGDKYPMLRDLASAGVELDLDMSRRTNTTFLHSADWFVGTRFEMHPEDEYDLDSLLKSNLN